MGFLEESFLSVWYVKNFEQPVSELIKKESLFDYRKKEEPRSILLIDLILIKAFSKPLSTFYRSDVVLLSLALDHPSYCTLPRSCPIYVSTSSVSAKRLS